VTAYCTPSDVASLNRARVMGAGTNQPNASDVQVMINMVGGEIDALLVTKGYEVPVNTASYPEAAAYLNAVNAKGALAMWEAASPNSPNVDRAEKAWMEAKTALETAREVMDIPKDETRAGTRGPGVSPKPAYGYHDRPYFRRHQQF
jgi:hypothetical protein